jgi:hypothetical protein
MNKQSVRDDGGRMIGRMERERERERGRKREKETGFDVFLRS